MPRCRLQFSSVEGSQVRGNRARVHHSSRDCAQVRSAEQEWSSLDRWRLGDRVLSVAWADSRVVFGAPRQFDASGGPELRRASVLFAVAGFGDPLQLLTVGWGAERQCPCDRVS